MTRARGPHCARRLEKGDEAQMGGTGTSGINDPRHHGRVTPPAERMRTPTAMSHPPPDQHEIEQEQRVAARIRVRGRTRRNVIQREHEVRRRLHEPDTDTRRGVELERAIASATRDEPDRARFSSIPAEFSSAGHLSARSRGSLVRAGARKARP